MILIPLSIVAVRFLNEIVNLFTQQHDRMSLTNEVRLNIYMYHL